VQGEQHIAASRWHAVLVYALRGLTTLSVEGGLTYGLVHGQGSLALVGEGRTCSLSVEPAGIAAVLRIDLRALRKRQILIPLLDRQFERLAPLIDGRFGLFALRFLRLLFLGGRVGHFDFNFLFFLGGSGCRFLALLFFVHDCTSIPYRRTADR
jgi:hypothetical protein